MNQNQLAELFATSVPNISMHISNILEDGELEQHSVIKDYLTTAADNKEYNALIADNDEMKELKQIEQNIKQKLTKN